MTGSTRYQSPVYYPCRYYYHCRKLEEDTTMGSIWDVDYPYFAGPDPFNGNWVSNNEPPGSIISLEDGDCVITENDESCGWTYTWGIRAQPSPGYTLSIVGNDVTGVLSSDGNTIDWINFDAVWTRVTGKEDQ